MYKYLNCRKGFTLIEIIVSIAILAIVITPLTSVFIGAFRMNAGTGDRLAANQLAQKYMEMWKASPLDFSADNGWSTENIDGKTYLAPADVTENGYTIRTRIAPLAPPPETSPAPTDALAISDYTMPSGGNETDFDATIIINSSSIEVSSDIITSAQSITRSSVTAEAELTDSMNITVKNGSMVFDYQTQPSVVSLLFGHADGQPVKIKVLINDAAVTVGETTEPRKMILNAYNELADTAEIYVECTSTGQGSVTVRNYEGEVSALYNIYDESVDGYDKNRLYEIIITVSKGSSYDETARILEIKGSKRIE